MPSREEHLRKESANAAFEDVSRQQGESPEWATTVLFHRAVHLVETYLAGRQVHHTSHRRRNAAIATYLPGVTDNYLALARLSRSARYDAPGAVGWSAYEEAQAAFVALEEQLRPLV